MSIDRSSPHPGVLDPVIFERYMRPMAPLVRRLWPSTLEGLERLPDHDRVIIIANHSGMGITELWALALLWHERYGLGSRPIAGMAHPGTFKVPLLGQALRGLGAVEATREGAAIARKAGVPLLLFPGGDKEATRPVWQADVVDFAGRKGWIKLAREHGLTVVPLCISGSHVTLPIVAHGRAVSWMLGVRPLLGIHRAPLPMLGLATAALALGGAAALELPLLLALAAAGAAVWPTMMLPWIPSRLGFHFLPPIGSEEIAVGDDQALYDRVVGDLGERLRAENARARAL